MYLYGDLDIVIRKQQISEEVCCFHSVNLPTMEFFYIQ
ncbi:hypothetical protein BACIT_1762 [Bacillus amyloliquefaciens]|nr:hypothetical protein BACIT_1762 [Bacillus amyloliquefaciens]